MNILKGADSSASNTEVGNQMSSNVRKSPITDFVAQCSGCACGSVLGVRVAVFWVCVPKYTKRVYVAQCSECVCG
jgi:hypothetical protein